MHQDPLPTQSEEAKNLEFEEMLKTERRDEKKTPKASELSEFTDA
jgi:hypothetical protein